MKTALLIYNPKAGSASGPELWLGSVVHRLCSEGGYCVNTVATTKDTTPDNILSGHINPGEKSEYDLIVGAGGDGTVRMLLHAVASQKIDIPVGIIPLGTGNLLARNLKIYEENLLSDPLEKAISILLSGSPMAIDMGIMNGHYFAAAAGAGPLSDAIVTPDSKDKETWKMLAYASSMVQTLTQAPIFFDIIADGEAFRIPASGIFITNIADLGVGMLSDSASMHDGLLDLCILSPREFTDYLKYGFHFAAPANAITGGKAPYYLRKVKKVEINVVKKMKGLNALETGMSKLKGFFTGKTPAVVSGQKVIAMIDGDAAGTTPMTISVAPLAVRVIAPTG